MQIPRHDAQQHRDKHQRDATDHRQLLLQQEQVRNNPAGRILSHDDNPLRQLFQQPSHHSININLSQQNAACKPTTAQAQLQNPDFLALRNDSPDVGLYVKQVLQSVDDLRQPVRNAKDLKEIDLLTRDEVLCKLNEIW